MSLNEVTVEIPKAEAVAIEYPGFVRNTQKALRTLGGIDDIAAAVSSKHYLKLKLRPEDRSSHPLYGERLEPIRLLLRIERPRQQPSGDGAGPSQTPAAGAPAPAAPEAQQAEGDSLAAAAGATARVVARVTPTFRFPGLADYAFIPHDPLLPHRSRDLLPYDQRHDRAEPTKAMQPLLLIPQLFSWLDLPQDYAFKQVHSKAHLRGLARAEPSWGDAPIISFYAEGVPPQVAAASGGVAAAAAAAAAAARSAPSGDGEPAADAGLADVRAYRVLETEVSRLLTQRPVWGLELMRERCAACAAVQAAMPGGCDAVAVERVVQRLCYRFKTGPWRGLFIRRGFDPRTDVDARKYQAIIYSLPNNWYRAMLRRVGMQATAGTAAAAPGAAETPAAAGAADASAAAAADPSGSANAPPPPAADPAAAAAAAGAGAASTSAASAPARAAAATWSPLVPSCQDDLHCFRALPTQQSTTLQLIDLQLKEVQEALQAPPSSMEASRCSEKTGWFSNATLQRMQNAVQQRFLELMEQLAPRTAAPAAAAAGGDASGSGGAAAAPAAAADAAGDVEMRDAAAATAPAAAAQPPLTAASAHAAAQPMSAADEALRALMAQMNLRGLSAPGAGVGGGGAGLFGSDDDDDEFRLLDEQQQDGDDDGDDGRGGGGDGARGMEEDGAAAAAGGEVGRGRDDGAGGRVGRAAAQPRADGGGGDGDNDDDASDGEESVYESEYDMGMGDDDDEEEDGDAEYDEEGGGGGELAARLGNEVYGGGGAYGRVTVPYDGGGVSDRRFDGGGGGMFGSEEDEEPY